MLYDFLTGCPDNDFQEDYTLVNAHCHSYVYLNLACARLSDSIVGTY